MWDAEHIDIAFLCLLLSGWCFVQNLKKYVRLLFFFYKIKHISCDSLTYGKVWGWYPSVAETVLI